jgi:peptide/nickel transport system substrate-binding protein
MLTRLTILLIAIGCASVLGGARTMSSRAAGTTFIDATATVPTTLDPAFREGKTSNQLTMWQSTLVRYKQVPLNSPTMQAPFQVQGYLVSSWKQVPASGGNEGGYQFTLRDATSSYGHKLTSADVLWSFQRMMAIDPVAKSVLNAGRVDLSNPITVIDPKTFQLNTHGPSALSLAVLTWYSTGILDSVEAQQNATPSDPWAHAWLATHTDTYGAYQSTDFTPGTSLTLVANPNYWAKLAFQTLVLSSVPDPSVRLQLMEANQASYTTQLTWDQFKSAVACNCLNAIPGRNDNTDFLALNFNYAPFGLIQVREAISMALDRKAMVAVAFDGYGRPALGQINSAFPVAWKSSPFTYNVAAAKALLAQTPYANGFTFTLSSTQSRTGSDGPPLSTLIQSELAPLGITVNIDIRSSSADFENDRTHKNLQAWLTTAQPSNLDDGFYMYLQQNCNATDTYTSFCDPKLDANSSAMMGFGYGKRRTRNEVASLKFLYNDWPWIPLVENDNQQVFAKNITGWTPTPFGVLLPDQLQITS